MNPVIYKINFRRGRAWATQELRYSALEVKDYVFGLKCLVPEPLRLMRKAG